MIATCTRHRSNFSALLDEEIEFNAKFDLQQHIGDCRECSGQLLKWREFQAFFEKCLHASIESVPDIWPELTTKLPAVCELVQEEFSAYLDDELSASAQDGVRAHLNDCQDCRKQFALLSKTNDLIAAKLKEPIESKVDLWSGIKSQMSANCALIKAELSPFVDQEVPNQHHRNVATHLLECASCSAFFRELSHIGELLQESYAPLLAEDFDLLPAIKSKMRIVPVAQEDRRVLQRNHAIMVSLAVVGVVVLIGLVVIGFLLFLHEPTRPITSEEYLINNALIEPSKKVETVVVDNVQ
jgi:anti-sigma factor RsiW